MPESNCEAVFAGPPLVLRRALYLAATAQVLSGGPLRPFYERKRSEGKVHREAVVAVAAKLARVVYAVLSRQEPFDPEVFARNSPDYRERPLDIP